MNFLSIHADLRNYCYYLILKTPEGIFKCDVDRKTNALMRVQINDDDLIKLRNFLNENFNRKEQHLNENT